MSNSIFLALNGAIVIVFSSLLYGDPIPFNLVAAAFLATFSVYSLNMITDMKEDSINRSPCTPKKTGCYVTVSAATMVASLALGLMTGVMTLLILIAPLLIGFAYSIQITKSLPRLKEVVGVKSVVVAFSWAITGAFLPVTLQPTAAGKEVLVFLYIFAQILVNTIIFDALDVKGDRASGIVTVPVAIGKDKTKQLLLIINGSLVGWILYCLFTGIFENYLFTLGFGVFYEYAIIWYFFSKDRRRFHAELLVDGEWLPLVFLMKTLLR